MKKSGFSAAIVILVIVVVAAAITGFAWYAKTHTHHTVSTSTPTAAPAVSTTTSGIVSPGSIKLGLIYQKHDRSVEDVIALFDPADGSIVTIKGDTGFTDFVNGIGDQLQQWHAANGTPLRLIYTRDTSTTSTEVFFLDGPANVQQFSVTHADSSVTPDNLFISPSASRIVYCSADGEPMYLDIIPYIEQAVQSQSQLLCTDRRPSSGFWFSKDEDTVYYSVVPTNENGSSTNGGYQQTRELNLITGQDTALSNPPGPFRNENYGWEQYFDDAHARMLDLWDGATDHLVTVRSIPSPDFDYISLDQARAWPVVAQFTDADLREAIITEDGRGVFYVNQVSSTQDFGYFDIATGKNYFPLFSYPNADPSDTELIGAFDQNNLLYTVQPSGSPGSQNAILYDGAISGQSSVVDNSWRGFDLLYFVAKNPS